MCEYCHQFPHAAECPEAPEPKPVQVGVCPACENPVYVDEDRFLIDCSFYHDDCIRQMTPEDLFELTGVVYTKRGA